MSCENFAERLSSYLDGILDAREQAEVLGHLKTCYTCHARWKSMGDMRARLRRLERPRIPMPLAVQLRVLASHEHARRRARASFAARLRYWEGAVRLNFENLMRPMALPVAGGVLSALLLFSALLPRLVFRHQLSDDQPLSLVDPHGYLVNWVGDVARLEPVDAALSSDENVLELTIDDKGKVRDYTVRQGKLTPEMLTIIQFSNLTPAMFFGRPTWGKVLVVLPGLRRSTRG
jgi:hypothetical protein